jgi:beta-glucosidase-like glycosyl hydrolase/CubicO group peptidase (beta-lactamase class C family)
MHKRRLLRWVAFFLLVAIPVQPQKAPSKAGGRALSRAGERWVERTLRRMTLEEKIGQLLMVFYYGGFTSTESEAYRELVRQVEQNRAGGLVLQTRGSALGTQRSQVYPAAVLANQLQRRARVPLLVAADFERGTSMRLEEGTPFPYAMGVAATGDPRDAFEMGRITAAEARAVGVHWIFAPVADVNINPANPIINTRSFGEDPQRVAEFVAAFVRGAEENGVLACAKHFPGHGDTSVDSHMDLSVVTADRARLEAVELVPFRAAIAAGVSTIMTGHLAVPALEPDREMPATLSASILTGALRKEMGFDGIIVTDALDMGGVTSRYAPAEVAVRAIEAGADVLLVPPIADAAVAALKQAVASGRIPMARLEESVRRVLRAKARLGLDRRREVDLDGLNSVFRRPEFAETAQRIADRGVTLLRNAEGIVPLDGTRPRRALLLSISADREAYPGEDLERELRPRVDALLTARADTFFAPVENLKLPPQEAYDIVLAAVFVRVADRKGTVGLPEKQAELLNALLAGPKPVVVMSFGSPYLVEGFPNAKTWMANFWTGDVAQRAAARALLGQTPIGGKIPVSVPGTAKRGEGLTTQADAMTLRSMPAETTERLAPAMEVLERAVNERILTGGVLAVGLRGEWMARGFGRATFEPGARAFSPEVIFHAAPLARPMVTSMLVMQQVQAGRVALDAPVSRYLPEFAAGPQPEWRARLTVRHLLLHTSGLPAIAGQPFDAQSRAELLKRAFAAPLEAEPGTRAAEAALNLLLLEEIVERMSGRAMEALAAERILVPLGRSDWARRGYEKATAEDIAAVCQVWLNGGIYTHQRMFPRRLMQQFAEPAALPGGMRALAWESDAGQGQAGKYFSGKSYGYSAADGSSVWIDPEKELFVIVLTKIVAADAAGRMSGVRAALHEAVMVALGPK